MESVLSNRERAMAELIQGRELASQLNRIFENRSFIVDGAEGGSAEGIVNKILGSFVNSLLIINGKESDQEFVSDQIQGNSSGGGGVSDGGSGGGAGADSSSWDANHDHAAPAITSEGYTEEQISCKSTSTFKDRRGSYKRRKTLQNSWTRDTPALTYDGHAWRKYGQKFIRNAKHSRNYFRCTHKLECKATKHVQQIQDHPPLFRTTYFGNHTCKDYLNASELVLNSASPRDSSKFICFDNANCLTNKQEHHFFSSFTSSLFKKEAFVKEDMPTTDHMVKSDHNHSSPCDHLVSNDLTAFESSGLMSEFSSSIDQYDYDEEFSRIIESYFENEVSQYGF
ncbi:WRKY transcription factor 70 [Pyrus ussuriensis x Pyrus communis]|uniref:WRKY transcription factor 70 n=1 Tax=Pyrus ussuriensis x Pyrus communis TaxID=2448454 RepID=A0A5N5H577_9ROSA|nr:WRKY transcription factor 70 [Pyrus ussuriensis x Pyrus communis]